MVHADIFVPSVFIIISRLSSHVVAFKLNELLRDFLYQYTLRVLFCLQLLHYYKWPKEIFHFNGHHRNPTILLYQYLTIFFLEVYTDLMLLNILHGTGSSPLQFVLNKI
jgi:hypothetical protein